MNPTSNIKRIFGNHNSMIAFLQYQQHLNDPDVLPPFRPVLFKSVNTTYPNYEQINETNRHKALIREIGKELNSKYIF